MSEDRSSGFMKGVKYAYLFSLRIVAKVDFFRIVSRLYQGIFQCNVIQIAGRNVRRVDCIPLYYVLSNCPRSLIWRPLRVY